MRVFKLELPRPSVQYVTEEPYPRNTTGSEIDARPKRLRFNGECPGRSRTFCPRCFAPCAIIAAPTLVRRGCIMADWSRIFEDPIPLPGGSQLVTLLDAGNYINGLPKADQQLDEWQAAVEALSWSSNSTGPP